MTHEAMTHEEFLAGLEATLKIIAKKFETLEACLTELEAMVGNLVIAHSDLTNRIQALERIQEGNLP